MGSSNSSLQRRNSSPRKTQRIIFSRYKKQLEELNVKIDHAIPSITEHQIDDFREEFENYKTQLKTKCPKIIRQNKPEFDDLNNLIKATSEKLDNLKKNINKPAPAVNEIENKSLQEENINGTKVELKLVQLSLKRPEENHDETLGDEKPHQENIQNRRSLDHASKERQINGHGNEPVEIRAGETRKGSIRDKRESVLKLGIPVMPNIAAELKARVELKNNNLEDVEAIRKTIEDIELEINDFVGKKDGKYYNNIRNRLMENMEKLTRDVSEDDVIEQVDLCKKYINNCLSFLDEKATLDDESDDDEIFIPVNDNEDTAPKKTLKTTLV